MFSIGYEAVHKLCRPTRGGGFGIYDFRRRWGEGGLAQSDVVKFDRDFLRSMCFPFLIPDLLVLPRCTFKHSHIPFDPNLLFPERCRALFHLQWGVL